MSNNILESIDKALDNLSYLRNGRFGSEATVNEMIDNTIADLKKAREGLGWRPIESAPKDGTLILAYWPTMSISQYPCVIFWDGDCHRDEWIVVNNRDYGEVYPTHFLPLPQPPTELRL